MALGLVGDLAREGYRAAGRVEFSRKGLIILGSLAGGVILLAIACRSTGGISRSVPSPERAAAIQRGVLQRAMNAERPAARPAARTGPVQSVR